MRPDLQWMAREGHKGGGDRQGGGREVGEKPVKVKKNKPNWRKLTQEKEKGEKVDKRKPIRSAKGKPSVEKKRPSSDIHEPFTSRGRRHKAESQERKNPEEQLNRLRGRGKGKAPPCIV